MDDPGRRGGLLRLANNLLVHSLCAQAQRCTTPQPNLAVNPEPIWRWLSRSVFWLRTPHRTCVASVPGIFPRVQAGEFDRVPGVKAECAEQKGERSDNSAKDRRKVA